MTTARPVRPPDLAPGTDDEAALLTWLQTMREEHPVWADRYGMWHVFRHADVLAVTHDVDVFSSDTARLSPAAAGVRRGMLTQLDAPEHRSLRHVVSAVFTPRTVAGLEPRIRELTRDMLDGAGESFDLVDALAFPLPVTVIADLLGLPPADHDRFRAWADGLFSMQVEDPRDPELGSRIGAAMGEISAYLVDQVRRRRADPAEDLISALVVADVEGRRLDDEEAANFSMLLLLAGHVTTTLLLGNAVRTFDEHPGTWAELVADPALIPGAIEEVLRFRPPFTQVGRSTTTETEIAGVAVPADAFVLPWLLSANRDPRAHPDPDRFDIRRGVGGGAQLAFGHGVHFCLGAPLARLEGRVALEEMTARYAAVEVVGTDLRPYQRGMLGTRRLPVRVTRR